MTDENIINNPYLDIVDAAVLGNTSNAAKTIQNVLNNKISDELENMSADISQSIIDDDDVDDDDIDDELETESDEDQSEN
tara:strand:- start:332 stop:571 length:240 start_codon:yes stop_codon:yes gene_type:complete